MTTDAESSASAGPAEPIALVRFPGLFELEELEGLQPILDVNAELRLKHVTRAPDGARLYAVWTRATDAPWSRRSSARDRARQLRGATDPADATRADSIGPVSLGELKARRREEHLCFGCRHQAVCGMSNALDENLLPTLSTCLGFDPTDDDHVCELMPLEPSAP